MTWVWISIGSNIERERSVAAALTALRGVFGPLRVSTVYETPAVGFEGAPFYNLVVGADTGLPAERVLARLGEIEQANGRVRGGDKFAARTLDLDLLTYGDRVGETAGKHLPHKDILEYDFVLRPLAELAPHERHPELGRTYAQLWAEMARRRQRGSMRPVEPVLASAAPAGDH
jgi:2-amino-4-hydroxy-6-hydroxymethyldihydropteridine diphosphokinase